MPRRAATKFLKSRAEADDCTRGGARRAAQGSGRARRRRPTRAWLGLLMVTAGCGGHSGTKPTDARPAGDGTVTPTRRQLLVVPSDAHGVAVIGQPGARAE